MKKYLLIIPILFLLISGFSQNGKYLPFQGKLYENGQPFDGEKTFSFSINDGGVNWTEIHSNVPINQGLYSVILGMITPLPDNLFKNEGMHELFILVEGNPLDEVMIYAPVENDPTIQENVKDGVSWSEIENIPGGLDTDVSNELQLLSISNDTLYISEGNFVVLPGNDLLNSNYFQVGQYDTINQPDVGQLFGNVLYENSTVWQSFKPSITGKMTAIDLEFNNLTSSGQIFLKIRPGEGTGQQPLGQTIYSASNYPVQGAPLFQTFYLSEPIPIILGNTYTFEIIKESSGDSNMRFKTDGTANSYPHGRSSIDPETDLKFIIKVDIITEPNFIVNSEGTVEAPSGRIKDKTGYVAFPGQIQMFAGPVENIPEGWLLCDGSLLDKNEYVDLFSSIGTVWGDGDGDPQKFRLPDLRGAFPRGVDNGANIDPDAAIRHNKYPGGNTSDNVGSFQENEAKEHGHEVGRYGGFPFPSFDQIKGVYPATVLNENVPYITGITFLLGSPVGAIYGQEAFIIADAKGGSESRPFNVYVNYIIKY